MISNNGQRKTIAYLLTQFTFALMIFLANVQTIEDYSKIKNACFSILFEIATLK
jgi:hypothetical protein